MQIVPVRSASDLLASGATVAGGQFTLTVNDERNGALVADRQLTVIAVSGALRSAPFLRTVDELRECGVIVLRLEETTWLRGRVVDATRSPSAGAIVRIDEEPQDAQAAWDMSRLYTHRQSVLSAPDGTFEARVRQGGVRVWVRASDDDAAFSASWRGVSRLGTLLLTGDLRVPDAQRLLRIRVSDPEGRPVAEAGAMLEYGEYVAAESPPGTAHTWHLAFDDDGMAALRVRADLNLLVVGVSAPRFETAAVTIDPSRWGQAPVEVTLRRRPTLRVEFSGAGGDVDRAVAQLAEVNLLGGVASDPAPRTLSFPSDTPPVLAREDELVPSRRAASAAAFLTDPVREDASVRVWAGGPGRFRVTIRVPGLGDWEDAVGLLEWGASATLHVSVPPARIRSVALVPDEVGFRALVHFTTKDDFERLRNAAPRQARGERALERRVWTPRWMPLILPADGAISIVVPGPAQGLVLQQFESALRRVGGPINVTFDDDVTHVSLRSGSLAWTTLRVGLVADGAALRLSGVGIEVKGHGRQDRRGYPGIARVQTGDDGSATLSVPRGSYSVRLAPASGGGPWLDVMVDGVTTVDLAP